MNEKRKPPKIIIVASTVGIILSVFGIVSPSLEALLILTVIPLLLCMGLLIKKWWVCGLLYCIVFLAARSGMFFGRTTMLAILMIMIVVALFIGATIAAYRYKKEI